MCAGLAGAWGYLAFTEAVWRTTDAPLEVREAFADYPTMGRVEDVVPLIQESGSLARRIVAEVELATPASERRLVQTDDFNETGRAYLELADATPVRVAEDDVGPVVRPDGCDQQLALRTGAGDEERDRGERQTDDREEPAHGDQDRPHATPGQLLR